MDICEQIKNMCPDCLTILENFNNQEGGYCPKCDIWWPPDIIREFIEENE